MNGRCQIAKFTCLALIALLSLVVPSVAFGQVETFDYTVEEGDTCESIAKDFYGHAGGCDLIEKYNSEGGEGPNFSPGNVLQLPTRVAKAEALVDRKHGSVRTREPDRSWHPAEIGEELYRSWRVNTLAKARAELAFRNASRLKMREETLVIIYGGSREEAERKRSRATLESGKLESHLDELAGEEGLEVESPAALTSLAAGDSLLDVRDDGTTRVANHGGDPIEVTGRGSAQAKKTVTVKEKMGTKVEQGKPPSPPQRLPPSPNWTQAPTDVLSFGGETRTVRAAWGSVDEAEEYFVELTADPEGVEVIKSAYVSSDVTELEVRQLPPGSYFATVSTIDGDGFESIPSERREIRVVPVDYDEATRIEGTEIPTFVLGARLSAPGQIRCAAGDGEPAGRVRLESPGKTQVSCTRPDGHRSRARTIEVATPSVEVGGRDVDAGTVSVVRGSFGLVDLGFSPSVPPNLDVAIHGGSTAIEVTPTPVGDARLRVKLAASREAPEEATLVVSTSDGSELVAVPVRLREPSEAAGRPSAAEAVPESTRSVRVGLVAGAAGRTDRASTAFLEGGGALGVLLGYLPNDHFALELAYGLTTLGRPGLEYGIDARALFAVPIGDVVPFVGGGFGVHTFRAGRVRPTLGVTGGANWWVGDTWGLRGGIGSDLTLREGEAIWTPKLQIGVLYRWQSL